MFARIIANQPQFPESAFVCTVEETNVKGVLLTSVLDVRPMNADLNVCIYDEENPTTLRVFRLR